MEKTYNHQEQEEQLKKLWEEIGVYRFEQSSPQPTFSIDTPPPTVSGTLHIGHIFSYTHTDLIARYKRMSGYNVFYPMGFDDNGLPTERYVEKQHKTKAHLHKRSDFINLCLEESHKVEKTFEELWKKMGLSIDWSKTYSTISKESQKTSQYSFIDLYKKGLVERRSEPALFCTTCRTSVAQAELDSLEVGTTFNTLVFIDTHSNSPLHIATTRPELLPACSALLYNPHDERYRSLEGSFTKVPYFNYAVPIIADELVDPQKGTGLVMCCTFGDQTDIAWYKKHTLKLRELINTDGTWNSLGGPLEGLKVSDARAKMIDLLKEEKLLIEQKPIKHAVHIHERCKQPIEYLVIRQWFVKILHEKEAFIKAGEKINWFPAFMQSRYNDWVSNLAWDWCISRQRFFGIPFPVWHCNTCSAIIVADEQQLPIDPQENSYSGNCPQCGGLDIVPDTDVMDTWATSALTPYINMNWPEEKKSSIKLPMTMRPQAHDIIRTWAFYTIVKAHYHSNTIPWNDIVISGHVLAGKEKISKSQGNEKLTPQGLLELYSADAVRYWAAKGRLGTDTAFSENQLKQGARLVTKLWNAFRLIKDHCKKNSLNSVNESCNRWIMNSFAELITTYHAHFEQYDYTHALDAVERFFWNDFCDNYLEFIKDRCFNPGEYAEGVYEETQTVLYNVGLGILQLYAPFVPYITESLYQLFYADEEKESSLHRLQFKEVDHKHVTQKGGELFSIILKIVSEVRRLKSEHSLSLKTELVSLTIHINETEFASKLKNDYRLLKGITQAHEIEIKNHELEQSFMEQVEDKWVAHISCKGGA